MSLAAVILAAGKGTRMNPTGHASSDLPKALHRVCGEPMLWHVMEAARVAGATDSVVVAGHRIDDVREWLAGRAKVVLQKPLLGSGHAVLQARKVLRGGGDTLVLYCDTPRISGRALKDLIQLYRKSGADGALVAVEAADPTGYGRVVMNGRGSVEKIVEENDANASEKKIRRVNAGCYIFNTEKLFGALRRIAPNAKKKEYYLTDAVGLLAREGKVVALTAERADEWHGVNTRLELAAIQENMQQKVLERWIESGVSIRDLRSTVIDAGVKIGAGTRILPHTVIEEASVIGRDCVIGPFARIRGGSTIGDGAVIGNFVEIVRSKIGPQSQVKHLSYLGDAVVGRGVNVGAGTITANYDGKRKHRTVIKDGAQIGSGTVLVAPVTVGKNAKTGAGCVVTKGKNVPDRQTVVGVPARKI